ncbi:hypothetical protein Golax_003681 [Gossypium laxum]|uniref:Uncharacterized protein n=1 Tax=Gossypium laxum TaxID=34288 RepID=A0A7J9AGE6_9ROSI|nr:hypothetical protein [Gossypium laxum]
MSVKLQAARTWTERPYEAHYSLGLALGFSCAA